MQLPEVCQLQLTNRQFPLETFTRVVHNTTVHSKKYKVDPSHPKVPFSFVAKHQFLRNSTGTFIRCQRVVSSIASAKNVEPTSQKNGNYIVQALPVYRRLQLMTSSLPLGSPFLLSRAQFSSQLNPALMTAEVSRWCHRWHQPRIWGIRSNP